jgi:hypothetical protein
VVPVPSHVHAQDGFTLLALAVADCRSRMTI